MTETTTDSTRQVNLGRMQWGMLLVGGVLVLISLALMFSGEYQKGMLQSYLWGWEFWGGLSFGCFAMTLLHHSLKGSWGTSVLRIWEAGGGVASLLGFGILFLPILATMFSGTSVLYAWADPQIAAGDHVLQHRRGLLNPIAAAVVTVLVLGFWTYLAGIMRQSTLRQDSSLDAAEEKKRFTWGPVGLVFFFLSAMVAVTVWFMSLDTHWSSTMYVPWFTIGHAFAALSLAVFIVCRFARFAPYSEIMSPQLTKDLGNMMLALTMFFSYLSFSQYLIIWSGNVPEFTSYYRTRAEGGWIWIGLSMVALQFFIPFLLLVNPSTKRYPRNLMMVAAWIFVVRVLDSYWIVLPVFPNRATPMPMVTDLIAFVGLGAIWFGIFATQIRKAPLLPVYDQRLKEALHHHA